LLVEKLNLTSKVDKLKAKTIFELADIEKKGKIAKGEFIETLSKCKTEDPAIISFIESLNLQLSSKAEIIVSKLKKIKEKAFLSKDNESIQDINWY
jgi:hypothetical protein